MNATPDKPKSPEAPASGGPLAPAGGPILEPLPGLNLGDTSIPSRGRVFGSNSITISRDTAYRDAVGVDLLSESTAGRLFGRDEVNGPPSWSSFFQAEYLLWWTNRQEIPVLASTGTETSAGYLGNAGTRTLLGPGQFGPSFRDGLRVRLGSYFDDCSGLGYDATFFFLGRRSESFAADPSQFPIITRPFFNQNSGTEFGEQVSFPELARGRLEIDADSFIWGGDINLRKALCRTCQGGYGWFAGYRHLNMTENLNMTEFITASGPLALPDPVGTRVVVGDRFRTENQFHGAQVGGFWQHRYGRLDIDGRASLAMGVTHQVVTVSGFQERTRPGEATQSFRGGLLAVGTNIGRFTSDRFSVVPEATVNVGYLIAPGVRTYVGYNFLYWSNVVRPGDQIDRTIDVTLIPNPPRGALPVGRDRPRIPFKQSDFWATGLQFGLEFRW